MTIYSAKRRHEPDAFDVEALVRAKNGGERKKERTSVLPGVPKGPELGGITPFGGSTAHDLSTVARAMACEQWAGEEASQLRSRISRKPTLIRFNSGSLHVVKWPRQRLLRSRKASLQHSGLDSQ